jgi:3-hydroxy-9,10-secoandrosta-1,3,5(10)-triene-9,17-dione monooxygenase
MRHCSSCRSVRFRPRGVFFSIGALQGALDLYREAGAKRVSHNDASSAAQDPATQELIAETAAAIDEMKATLNRNSSISMPRPAPGGPPM